MTVQLRNKGDAVDLYRPAGEHGTQYVKTKGVIDLAGVVADTQPTADAIVVDYDGELRAWPRAQWEFVTPAHEKAWQKARDNHDNPPEQPAATAAAEPEEG